MSHRKKLFLEIGLMFITVVFSNWLVSLGEDGPSCFVSSPLRCFGIALLLSTLGGYALHRLKSREEAKSSMKS